MGAFEKDYSKDEMAEVLQQVITQVADPEGINIGKIRCDGWREFEGRIFALAEPFRIKIEPNAHTSRKET